MKETEGERVVKAIQKLADKIRKLENERQQSKVKVESLTVQEISSTKASDFFQRLAKAEARCKALQQQLAYIRKIVREAASLDFDGNLTLASNDSVDVTSTFGSLPSIASILDDALVEDHVKPDKLTSAGRNQSNVRKPAQSAFSSNILEVPVYEHFKHSIPSRPSIAKHVIPTHDYNANVKKLPDTFMELNKADKSSPYGQHLQKEHDSKIERTSSTYPSDESSLVLLSNNAVPAGQSHKKRRSLSQTRNSAGTPLGQFLPSSRNKCDLVSHYHVKVNEIPFCSATKSGKSHSLGANLQNLMSMVKVCHPSLCSAAPLHRRRSRSVERQYTDKRKTCRQDLARWNSASALDRWSSQRGRMRRSSSLEVIPCRETSPQAHTDLDLFPVKLKPNKDKNVSQVNKEKCETPGNVCIRTEIKPLPVGSNKVVEVKMTTTAKPKCQRLYRSDNISKRRELLKDVQELQYMVESDQCC